MKKRKPIIGVIGSSECDHRTAMIAEKVGALIAQSGWVLITGGLGGVMEAASKGAHLAHGTVIGILPSNSANDANIYVDIPIVTALGDARNTIIANTACAFIALSGGYGTLSEIAFALKRNKPVVGLMSWEVDPKILKAKDPEDAIKQISQLIK